MRARSTGIRRSVWAAYPVWAAYVAWTAACTDASQSTSELIDTSVDTLASGRVVVSSPDQPTWSSDEAPRLEEWFRLGSASEDGPELFGEIRDVELDRDGLLYVLDAQASEIRVFGTDGIHVRTFGGPGEGPGELNSPSGMTLDSDGILWVLNRGNARYTGFDPGSGEVHDERRRLASYVEFPWPGAFDDRGRLVDTGLGRDGAPSLLRTDTSFTPVDTLALPRPDEDSQIAFRTDGLRVMSLVEPFAPRPTWAPHPGGGIVVGEGAAYRLHRIGFKGDTTSTIELSRSPEPVTPAERDSALEVFAEVSERAGGAIPDRQPRVRETKPLHGPLFVDHEARIWVRATPTAGVAASWDLFSPAGRYLGGVAVPVTPSFVTPAVRDDRLAVVTQVEGVPMVVVYRMTNPAS